MRAERRERRERRGRERRVLGMPDMQRVYSAWFTFLPP